MPILFTCSCGRRLRAGAEHAGRTARCPNCDQETTVPAAGAGPTAEVTTAPGPVTAVPSHGPTDAGRDQYTAAPAAERLTTACAAAAPSDPAKPTSLASASLTLGVAAASCHGLAFTILFTTNPFNTFAVIMLSTLCGIVLAVPGAILGLITLAREDCPNRVTGTIGSCLNVLILVGWLVLCCGGAMGRAGRENRRPVAPPGGADFFR